MSSYFLSFKSEFRNSLNSSHKERTTSFYLQDKFRINCSEFTFGKISQIISFDPVNFFIIT